MILRAPAAVVAAGVVAFGALLAAITGEQQTATADGLNAYLDDAQAIAKGRSFYRRRCFICHHRKGGRGPNLFAQTVTFEQFVKIVAAGRKGTQMPAFGARMSTDEIAYVHAYVMSTDHYE
ncbi:MAG: c-type cytochrome [Geminicoccaceae bacterium]